MIFGGYGIAGPVALRGGWDLFRQFWVGDGVTLDGSYWLRRFGLLRFHCSVTFLLFLCGIMGTGISLQTKKKGVGKMISVKEEQKGGIRSDERILRGAKDKEGMVHQHQHRTEKWYL
jgi:hypothetical protein